MFGNISLCDNLFVISIVCSFINIVGFLWMVNDRPDVVSVSFSFRWWCGSQVVVATDFDLWHGHGNENNKNSNDATGDISPSVDKQWLTFLTQELKVVDGVLGTPAMSVDGLAYDEYHASLIRRLIQTCDEHRHQVFGEMDA